MLEVGRKPCNWYMPFTKEEVSGKKYWSTFTVPGAATSAIKGVVGGCCEMHLPFLVGAETSVLALVQHATSSRHGSTNHCRATWNAELATRNC